MDVGDIFRGTGSEAGPIPITKQMLVRIPLVLWMSVSMPMPLAVLEIHHFCYRSLPSRHYQRKKLNFSTGGRHDL